MKTAVGWVEGGEKRKAQSVAPEEKSGVKASTTTEKEITSCRVKKETHDIGEKRRCLLYPQRK